MAYVERYIYIYVHQYTWYLKMVDLLMTELPATRRGTRRGMRTGTQRYNKTMFFDTILLNV